MSVDAEKLRVLAQQSAAGDGGYLLMAKEKAKERMKADPSPQNIKAFQEASRALDGHLARADAEGGAQPVSFKSVPAALSHLKEQGWKVSRAKIFADAASGLLKRQPDGSVTGADLDRYVVEARLKLAGEPAKDGGEMARLKIRQTKAEIREREAKAEMAEMATRERAGELISREEADNQMAQAVTVLRSQMKAFFGGLAPEVVHTIKGDPGKMDELLDLFNARSNEFFNGFSKKREYKVVESHEPAGLD